MLVRCAVLAVGAVGLLAAQHGGGGGGGHHGGGGGFSNSGSGFRSAAPSSGISSYTPNRAVVPPPSYSGHLTFSTPGMTVQPMRGSSGVRPVWGGRPPVRRPGGYGSYGLGLYPYLGYGYYGDDFSTGYYAPPAVDQQPQYAPYPEMSQQPYGDAAPIPYVADQPPATTSAPEPPSTPITLVLKNGQKLQVQNYAIMNGMFWDFSKPNSKRIPLTAIDAAASAKATDEAGGAFPEESFVTNPK